ncbi:glucokinase [Parvibaculum lavamentivorans DS-1]|uniref:Glucokinase n=1 Tax=Parvibaculum lavamentivorans (strain DS-1 / DSM 13023 / NCIMB 13966) TaxID=402881 RepID=A7HPU9_PARL1|nr:glucokinase [Parvibaculum lavamentivorans DS-1]
MSLAGEASLLVADIGGTNARFALAASRNGRIEVSPPIIFQTADYASLELALSRFLEEAGRPLIGGVAACAAGPVQGTGAAAHIAMTNCPWDVTAATLTRVTDIKHPRLMNDFAALALSIPALTGPDLHAVGPARDAVAGAPVGILGAGTGLGVSTLVFDGGRDIVVAGEGGHVDLAASNVREAAVLAHLQSIYGHVSVERVLSGPGLVALYTALAALSGEEATPAPSPVEVAARARAGTCVLAEEAVRLFCGWLGAVAGDLALTVGARGGIYIGGGIVPGWLAAGPGLFDEALFRARFEAKGRFDAYLSDIPVFVIRRADAALLGLARAARAPL